MYLTFTIDTEEEWDWATGWPREGYGVRNIAALPGFREQCRSYGIAFTCFTNHAVLADAEARRLVGELAREPQVEIGLHVHPWNTPPLAEKVDARNSFLHNLPFDLARAKLDETLRLGREIGLAPTSYRGGRYSTSPEIRRHLAERGFLVDSSAVPYTTWHDDGAPDYGDRDPWPCRETFGDRPLWTLPLSRGFTRPSFRFWSGVYDGIARSWLGRLRVIGILEKLHIVRKVWLNFEQHDVDDMMALVPVLEKMGVPYLCFTMHSSTLLPGGSPYASSDADVRRFTKNVTTTLARLRDRGAKPVTMTEVARHLEADADARARYQSAR